MDNAYFVSNIDLYHDASILVKFLVSHNNNNDFAIRNQTTLFFQPRFGITLI